MKTKRLTSLLTIIAVVLSGCGQQILSLHSISALENINRGGSFEYFRPQCEVQTSDYELDTHINSFVMYSKLSGDVGFDIAKGFLKLIGINISLEKGVMDMMMDLIDPIDPQTPLVDVHESATLKKFQFDAHIDLVKAGAGFNYFYQTPLSELTLKTIENNFLALVKQLNKVQSTWRTNVVVHSEVSSVIIPVGSIAGIKTGDTFRIYNVENIWKGEPCGSQFVMSRKLTQEPVALARAVQVETNATALIVYQGNGEFIQQGARVEIHELVKEKNQKRADLLRSIRFRNTTSGKLMIDDKTEIDIVGYVKEELRSTARNSGFYIKQ